MVYYHVIIVPRGLTLKYLKYLEGGGKRQIKGVDKMNSFLGGGEVDSEAS